MPGVAGQDGALVTSKGGGARALVTGGAGFIASHVADRLLAEGWEVTSLDNFDPYYDPAKKRRNVAAAQGSASYRLVEADVCDGDALARVFDEATPDVVVHLAARAGVRASVADPWIYVGVNEVGGLNVLEQARRRGNVPIVFASTSSVYGASTPAPFREDAPADRPLSPYAASKRGSEMMAHAYHHLHGVPVAVARFFTVYGPRGRPDMAFWRFTEALRAGRPLRLHGEATERDFTFVGDIVDGVVGAIGWVRRTRGFDTFNLGRSEPVRVRHVIETLARAMGVTPDVELGDLEPGESAITAADVSKARAAFGYAPRVSLEEGVARWLTWWTAEEASGAT